MAIQIGIKNKALRDYLDKYIKDITDITKSVTKWRDQIKTGKFKKDNLPRESIYPVSDEIKKRLGMY